MLPHYFVKQNRISLARKLPLIVTISVLCVGTIPAFQARTNVYEAALHYRASGSEPRLNGCRAERIADGWSEIDDHAKHDEDAGPWIEDDCRPLEFEDCVGRLREARVCIGSHIAQGVHYTAVHLVIEDEGGTILSNTVAEYQKILEASAAKAHGTDPLDLEVAQDAQVSFQADKAVVGVQLRRAHVELPVEFDDWHEAYSQDWRPPDLTDDFDYFKVSIPDC